MKFDAGTRTRILIDMRVEIDPASSTIEYRVDSTWYPCTWLAAAVHTSARLSSNGAVVTPEYWTQTARTNGYFAGPDAVASGAVVLALGAHETETRLTSGGDILTEDGPRIQVRP